MIKCSLIVSTSSDQRLCQCDDSDRCKAITRYNYKDLLTMTLLDTLAVSMFDQCVIKIDRFLYCNFYIMLVKTWCEEVRVKNTKRLPPVNTNVVYFSIIVLSVCASNKRNHIAINFFNLFWFWYSSKQSCNLLVI